MMIYHPIELLSLSTVKQNQFLKKEIETIEDLATFFPYKYYNFQEITPVQNVIPGNYYAMEGVVIDKQEGNNRYTVTLEEDQPNSMNFYQQFSAVWFGSKYHYNKLVVGQKYIICGKVTEFFGTIQISSPVIYGQSKSICKIMSVYSKIQGMSREYLEKQIQSAIEFLKTNCSVSERDLFADQLHLKNKFEAMQEIHNPTNSAEFKSARTRIAFEQIYDFYEDLKAKDVYRIGTALKPFQKSEKVQEVIANLPFQLTNDQQSVMDAILREAKEGHRIHSLISGDVGCGKTMIAILSAVFAWENGYQTIVTAPTLVLAQQHYREFQAVTKNFDIRIALLTSETKAKEKKKILDGVSDGTFDILIGTHAVLGNQIIPKHLGFTIIDEEHKFGVRQKEALYELNRSGVHHLSMTATPIPRSIAMTVYGTDFSVLPIRTMPKGRKPIITKQCFQSEEAFDILNREIQTGRQGYIVCPFIEDSENPKFENVISVEAVRKMTRDYFGNRVRIGVISGDMKQKDIISTVSEFEKHNLDILISTTIVEVGVNVPNASVIAIFSAEHFGLASLHQLRGRVGRSDQQGYCLLCSETNTPRLNVLCHTTDGFQIAEQDLKLRGPGDLAGEEQSGNSKVIELILKRPKLAETIRKKVLGK